MSIRAPAPGIMPKYYSREAAFAEAVERARWSAYPLGLAMVGEMTEGVLRPHAGRPARAALDGSPSSFCRCSTAIPSRRPIGADAWRGMRAELERHLDLVGGHAPKRVIDIPEPLAEKYFALMPIHEKLRGRDFHDDQLSAGQPLPHARGAGRAHRTRPR